MPAKLERVVADLHVHTVLSACAGIEMIPPLIVEQALACGLSLIAITDHNASANVQAVLRAAAGSSLAVLPGMELQTVEDVHVLCLFDTATHLSRWQSIVDTRMPVAKNVPAVLGEQLVVDETGEFMRREERLLATAANITLKQAIVQVTELGGLAIPAHVDRPGYGLLITLGFVPTDVEIEALEISPNATPRTIGERFPELAAGKWPLIQGGDVHFLDGFCTTTVFFIAEPSISEIRLALRGRAGRCVEIFDSAH